MAKLPKDANILYRKMSLKSMFSYGKYEGYTVSNVLKVDPIWLAWTYYNQDRISFLDDILDYLQVERISKPGKNERKYFAWLNKMKKATDGSLLEIRRKFEDAKAAEQISRQIDKDEKKARKQVRDMFKKFE